MINMKQIKLLVTFKNGVWDSEQEEIIWKLKSNPDIVAVELLEE
jgi:hypothetical protein